MTIADRWNHWRSGGALERWALLPLRLVVGFGFAAHGYAKLSHGLAGFTAVVAAMGIPAPGAMAWATALIELLSGILMMVGAFVAPLTLPMVAIMLTALFGVHLQYGFSSIKLVSISATGAVFGPPGIEVNLLYLAALATLAGARPSAWSVDRWLAPRLAARRA